jgi:serine-type D-Ala-D-Ala endopeptidase (penicillin-binding protein 7)
MAANASTAGGYNPLTMDSLLTRRRLLAGGLLTPAVLLPSMAGAAVTDRLPGLSARHAYVGSLDDTLLAIDADRPVQIASISKLITAWVVLTAELPLAETIRIEQDDVVRSEHTRSSLAVGSRWQREQLLEWLVVASDNRAAAALARTYPGGWDEFRYAMRALMTQMQLFSFDFGDAAGLSSVNQASARDLGVLLVTLAQIPYFQALSRKTAVGGKLNVNRFAHDRSVALLAGKTGFTSAAGFCLAEAEQFGSRVVAMVVLNASDREARARDMTRLRNYARERLSGA